MKTKTGTYLLAAILLAAPGRLYAQQHDTVRVTRIDTAVVRMLEGSLTCLVPPTAFRSFAFVSSASPWLSSENAAGLTAFLRRRNISQADVAWQRGWGDFTDFSQSHQTVQIDAGVESFYRLNRRSVVYGKMMYNNFSGEDMGGSVFVNPDRKPFDIVEDSLTNLGRKHRDTYHLVGAVGIDLFRGIGLGLKADYTAANYAKYKDLRHFNKLMSLKFTAGIRVLLGRRGSAGAHYLYRRNTESVRFSTYGRVEKTFKSLIDYAGFMGEVEQFGNYGYTNKNLIQMLFDEYQGGAVQLEWQLGKLSFFNELMAAHRTGFYGKDSPYSVIHSQHRSAVYQYHAVLTFRQWRTHHRLALTLDAENLENHRTTYIEQRNDNGVSYYNYFDPVRTANKLFTNGSAIYTGFINVQGDQPIWRIDVGARWMHRRQTAYRYPYYRRQDLRNIEGFAQVERNVIWNMQMLTAMLGASFSDGSGAPFEDATFVAPSDKQTPPPTMNAWLYREYAVLTAAQFELQAALKYSFVVPRTSLPMYIKAQINYRHAAHAPYVMQNRHRATFGISAGCTF